MKTETGIINSPLQGCCSFYRARSAWRAGLDIQYREHGEWVDFTQSRGQKLPIEGWDFPALWRIKHPNAD